MSETAAARERVDDLQCGGMRILQRPDLFLFGTDSVLLADFAASGPGRAGQAGESVLDLGTGSGVLMLLMSARMPDARFTGVELSPEMADLARRSIAMNGLEPRIEIAEMDLRDAPTILKRSFHRVVCNPPYGKAGGSYLNQNEARRLARHEVACTPDDVARVADALLLPRGRLFMCHQPGRMLDVADAMRAHGLVPKRARLVLPAPGYPPCLLLLEAVRGGQPGLAWDPPLLLRDEHGNETRDYHIAYGMETS